MISNVIVETKMLSLKKQKAEYVAEKNQLIEAIKTFRFRTQAAHRAERGWEKIPEDILDDRNKIALRLNELDGLISAINKECAELHRVSQASKNRYLGQIFKEIFTQEQLSEIGSEAERRSLGEPPMKVSIDLGLYNDAKKQRDVYKKTLTEQLDKLQEVRILLTRILDEGCKKFDQTEFMRLMSPLNRLIIPVEEINKVRAKLQPMSERRLKG